MAKKKGAEKVTESQVEDASAEHAGEEQAADVDATLASDAESGSKADVVEAATPDFAAAEALGLVAEVQSFLSKRGELAEKLAREIEATEKKLEELKRTAALLSPPPAAAAVPVEPARPEKKTKKPTLKKPEKKAEKPRGLLDHAEASGDDGAAVEPTKPQAEEELVAQG